MHLLPRNPRNGVRRYPAATARHNGYYWHTALRQKEHLLLWIGQENLDIDAVVHSVRPRRVLRPKREGTIIGQTHNRKVGWERGSFVLQAKQMARGCGNSAEARVQ